MAGLRKKSVPYKCLMHFARRLSIHTETKSGPRDSKFVPQCSPVTESDVDNLKNFIFSKNHLFVLTGAGISTESGIPDYRSEGVGLYATSKNRPVDYSDFLKKSYIRQRYWARNTVGWPQFSSALPNASHHILRKLEKMNIIYWLVTQNVDALHYKAGSVRVTELHGSTHRVMCLSCSGKMSRVKLQEMINDLNPGWSAISFEIGPDGDVQLTDEQITGFKVPECPRCGGVLKPEVVFFGDNVPKPTVNSVHRKLIDSDGVLVMGSSLQVYSAYRFVSAAHHQNKPIAIVNIGPTRADNIASLKINARCTDILEKIIS